MEERSIWVDETFTLFEGAGHGIEVGALLNSECEKVIKATNALPVREYKKLIQYDPSKSVKDCLVSIIETDTQPPLYYLSIHFWMKFFGDSLFSIRLFSVLLGIAAIITAYFFTTQVFGRSSGIFAAIFLAVSPFFVFFSQEARNYSMILFIILLNGYFFVRLKNEQSSKVIIGYIITTVCGLLTHYFYSLVLLGQIFYVMIFGRSDINIKLRDRFYGSLLISLLLISPWGLTVVLHGYNYTLTEWIFGFPSTFVGSLKYCFNVFLSLFAAPYDYPRLRYSILILLLFLLKFLFNPRSRKGLIMIFAIFSVPLAFMFVVDLLEKAGTLMIPRYYMLAFAGVVPVVGYLFSSGWKEGLFRAVTILIIAIMLMSSIITVNGWAWQDVSIPRVKEACVWINSHSVNKKAAVIINSFRASVIPDVYYLNDDILIIPVGSAEEFREGLESIRGKFDVVFVAQHTFNKIFGEPIESWYKNVGSPGFRIVQEKAFDSGDILIRKFQSK
ncbi:MAG: glycosyltransferase family 39 protein [Candidatus Omnitrophota bacterium]